MKKLIAILALLTLTGAAFAQMTRKPSPSREPAGVVAKPDATTRYVESVGSREEFEQVARVYHRGTPYEIPHVMFVIDRKRDDRVFYVNSQKYRFHKDFLLANYLVPRGSDLFEPLYLNEDRRFIVGTVAWQQPVESYTFELWEGDMASAALIKLAYERLNETFYSPIFFKPNSIRQDDLTSAIEIKRITSDQISRNQEYLALNPGKAIGRVHVIEKLDDTVEIGDNEILVLKELPLNLPPVRGIIVAKQSTPLSHVNILAKGWGIPNVYIKDADKLFKSYHTWWAELDADLTGFKFKRLVDFDPDKRPPLPKPPDQLSAPADLSIKALAPLRSMRKKDSVVYGAKAANLGELMNARIPATTVPDGFGIPYHHYARFMRDNGFNKIIDEYGYDLEFVHNPRHRRQKLTEFRKLIETGKMDPALEAEILKRWREQLGGKAVFVRSSSNAEDLPNFSGAGLYTTVKNVVEAEKIISAVKTVWASLWNFDAYEARVRNYVDQSSVNMGVLIQVGVDMEIGGVMITKDPFDPDSSNTVYVSAVWGHSDPVTGNKFVPEQLLYNRKSNAVQLLTLSQQDAVLRFDPAGDLIKTDQTPERRVLTDKKVRELVRVAERIKSVFGGKYEQDIEWGIMEGKIFLLQARPFRG